MILFNILLLPLMAIMGGQILKGYNPKYYDNHWKYISQNGVNLTFLKFNEKQWDYFLKRLVAKNFNIIAIISFIFNIITYFIEAKNPNIDSMMINTIFFIILCVLDFVYMIKKTKKIN
ncbi:MAG: hypothetical protein Q7K36_07325 [Fusobacterium sp. JB020]|nr:hypothetical protein [Fusobacterium sp. JB020]